MRTALLMISMVLALCGCESDAQWGARNCRDRGIPEGTPAFDACVRQQIANLHQTWQQLNDIRTDPSK